MCKYVLMKQTCPKGVACSYSHSLKHLDEVVPHFKSRMCSAIMKGLPCVKECTFAHTPEELVLRPCQFGKDCYNIHSTTRVCHFIHPGDNATTYPKRTGLKWPRDVAVPPQRKKNETRIEKIFSEPVAPVEIRVEHKDLDEPARIKSTGTAEQLIEDILAAQIAGVSLEEVEAKTEAWPKLAAKKTKKTEAVTSLTAEESWADHVEKFGKYVEENAVKPESDTESVPTKRSHSAFSQLSKEEAEEAREVQLDEEETKRRKSAPEESLKTEEPLKSAGAKQKVMVEFTPEQFALVCTQLMQMRVSFRTVDC